MLCLNFWQTYFLALLLGNSMFELFLCDTTQLHFILFYSYRIHGMAVCDNAKYFHGEINKVLRELGLQDGQGSSGVRSEDIVDVVEGVKGLGYGVSQPEELECINQVARTTGIFVDPVYTGKATFHLMRLMKEEPDRFQGSKILFIHTGKYDILSRLHFVKYKDVSFLGT